MKTACSVAHYSGLLLFNRHRSSISIRQTRRINFQFVKISRIPIRQSFANCKQIKCAATGGNGHRELMSKDRFDSSEPFWLSMIKDVAWSLRSLAVFLREQPIQLKYIEWPTFQSTVKTASLTLVLVAFLIVALSSIDSALCYTSALLVRKTA
ncbi:uncharacterized protein [Elaeis guineensis]|uniref:Uncharacterized protein LOC105034760 isoform X1 n=1 Tax=Elaeis guineensis var. tenera TaxID=51953 RepID=A0A6I9QF06_ELAGV|nr:uncharacterized protein LOC105034760 isoform X1 [Elaeis guineensis]XP_010908329.1 uncharacterized protein LOC105034760 isoform X1 [Elaeis guineensis]XP_029117543.1 uncharacterized protein LOC105034760 isoform X1 [Elaeis guineensis]